MNTKLIVAEDFYQEPDVVREFALSQDFTVVGNFPSARTESFWSESAKETIQKLVMAHGGNITYWPNGYNGAFQFTTKKDKSWIHADSETTWAAIVYLTPNAPLNSGTGLFKHKPTGLTEWPDDTKLQELVNADSQNYEQWEIVDSVSNIYNRIVLYRGYAFHQSLEYFGTNKHNGRLFQTFFFNTEF